MINTDVENVKWRIKSCDLQPENDNTLGIETKWLLSRDNVVDIDLEYYLIARRVDSKILMKDRVAFFNPLGIFLC